MQRLRVSTGDLFYRAYGVLIKGSILYLDLLHQCKIRPLIWIKKQLLSNSIRFDLSSTQLNLTMHILYPICESAEMSTVLAQKDPSIST